MNERDSDSLADMLTFASDAIELLGERDAAALRDDMRTRYALIRAVELVGEAATRVSSGTRDQLSGVPWREVIGMRNILVHGYDGINLNVVVNVVLDHMPALIAEIRRVLGQDP